MKVSTFLRLLAAGMLVLTIIIGNVVSELVIYLWQVAALIGTIGLVGIVILYLFDAASEVACMEKKLAKK